VTAEKRRASARGRSIERYSAAWLAITRSSPGRSLGFEMLGGVSFAPSAFAGARARCEVVDERRSALDGGDLLERP